MKLVAKRKVKVRVTIKKNDGSLTCKGWEYEETHQPLKNVKSDLDTDEQPSFETSTPKNFNRKEFKMVPPETFENQGDSKNDLECIDAVINKYPGYDFKVIDPESDIDQTYDSQPLDNSYSLKYYDSSVEDYEIDQIREINIDENGDKEIRYTTEVIKDRGNFSFTDQSNFTLKPSDRSFESFEQSIELSEGENSNNFIEFDIDPLIFESQSTREQQNKGAIPKIKTPPVSKLRSFENISKSLPEEINSSIASHRNSSTGDYKIRTDHEDAEIRANTLPRTNVKKSKNKVELMIPFRSKIPKVTNQSKNKLVTKTTPKKIQKLPNVDSSFETSDDDIVKNISRSFQTYQNGTLINVSHHTKIRMPNKNLNPQKVLKQLKLQRNMKIKIKHPECQSQLPSTPQNILTENFSDSDEHKSEEVKVKPFWSSEERVKEIPKKIYTYEPKTSEHSTKNTKTNFLDSQYASATQGSNFRPKYPKSILSSTRKYPPYLHSNQPSDTLITKNQISTFPKTVKQFNTNNSGKPDKENYLIRPKLSSFNRRQPSSMHGSDATAQETKNAGKASFTACQKHSRVNHKNNLYTFSHKDKSDSRSDKDISKSKESKRNKLHKSQDIEANLPLSSEEIDEKSTDLCYYGSDSSRISGDSEISLTPTGDKFTLTDISDYSSLEDSESEIDTLNINLLNSDESLIENTSNDNFKSTSSYVEENQRNNGVFLKGHKSINERILSTLTELDNFIEKAKYFDSSENLRYYSTIIEEPEEFENLSVAECSSLSGDSDFEQMGQKNSKVQQCNLSGSDSNISNKYWRTSRASTNSNTSNSSSGKCTEDTMGQNMSELSSVNSHLSYMDDSFEVMTDLKDFGKFKAHKSICNQQSDMTIHKKVLNQDRHTVKDAISELEILELTAKNLLQHRTKFTNLEKGKENYDSNKNGYWKNYHARPKYNLKYNIKTISDIPKNVAHTDKNNLNRPRKVTDDLDKILNIIEMGNIPTPSHDGNVKYSEKLKTSFIPYVSRESYFETEQEIETEDDINDLLDDFIDTKNHSPYDKNLEERNVKRSLKRPADSSKLILNCNPNSLDLLNENLRDTNKIEENIKRRKWKEEIILSLPQNEVTVISENVYKASDSNFESVDRNPRNDQNTKSYSSENTLQISKSNSFETDKNRISKETTPCFPEPSESDSSFYDNNNPYNEIMTPLLEEVQDDHVCTSRNESTRNSIEHSETEKMCKQEALEDVAAISNVDWRRHCSISSQKQESKNHRRQSIESILKVFENIQTFSNIQAESAISASLQEARKSFEMDNHKLSDDQLNSILDELFHINLAIEKDINSLNINAADKPVIGKQHQSKHETIEECSAVTQKPFHSHLKSQCSLDYSLLDEFSQTDTELETDFDTECEFDENNSVSSRYLPIKNFDPIRFKSLSESTAKIPPLVPPRHFLQKMPLSVMQELKSVLQDIGSSQEGEENETLSEIWTPGDPRDDTGPAKIHTNDLPSFKEVPPVWTPRSASASPGTSRRSYRKLDCDVECSKKSSSHRTNQEGKPSPQAEESYAWKNRELDKIQTSSSCSSINALPKIQSPTVTLLQKKREGHIPVKRPDYDQRDNVCKPGDKLYTIKREYESDDETGTHHKYAVLGAEKVEGVGPIANGGIPVTLKSGIKSEHQGEWYKRMFDSLHKVKDGDEILLKYKRQKGRYGAGGYASEPEYYDSDGGTTRYVSLNRKSHKFDYDVVESHPKLFSGYLRTPNLYEWNTKKYAHQPGRIENYVPGFSTLSQKELINNPEADVKVEIHTKDPISATHRFENQRRMQMSHALKDGYESDSTLVFRKKDDYRKKYYDQKYSADLYRQIQQGGEIPFSGLQKPAPHPPRDSPYKYKDSEVNIHYRLPVRNEQKEVISDEELVRRQDEHMKRIYEQERRKKYLSELEDIERRRHTDNFTPQQKSPIPLNRYDEEAFSSPIGVRTPEPRQVAKVLYNFAAQNKREITLNKGDVVTIRRQIDRNWYEGEVRGVVGIFPANYVEIVPFDSLKSLGRKPREGQGRARFNFQAQTTMELSLNKGDMVLLTRRVDENWYEGRVGNRRGIFPVTYVEVLHEPGPERHFSPQRDPIPRPALPASHLLYNGTTSTALSSPFSTMGRPTSRTETLKSYSQLTVNTQNAEPLQYKALYHYKPQNEDELELRENDVVHVMEKCDDGWFVGTSKRTGLFGTFPGNYVERC